MGLQQFEQRLERLVEGVFAKAFRSGLAPVEIGRRVSREMDLHRTVGIRGVMVPNAFTIALSRPDMERFASFTEVLRNELAEAVREHARTEGYRLVGPPEIVLEEDRGLSAGVFMVAGEIRAPAGGPAASVVLPDGKRVQIGEEPVVIGRMPECDVVLPDPNVSRRHAELRRDGLDVVVVDLDSTNGTRVNGVGVERRRLADGDEISIGSTAMRFEAA